MSRKSEHIQIRVSPREKAALKRAAAAAGEDLSAYVLARALPTARRRFAELIEALHRTDDHRYVLADLNDLLSALSSAELQDAVADAAVDRLPLLIQNYVAAMVEHTSTLRGVAPPKWTARVPGLEMPHFATSLRSLRPYLLRASPVAFRRRNIFVDATVGARV